MLGFLSMPQRGTPDDLTLQMETLGHGASREQGSHMQVCLKVWVPSPSPESLLTWILYCCLLCL